MAEIDSFAVGRTDEGKIVLAFFDGLTYENGANMPPEKAMEVAHDLRRKAKYEIKEGED